MGEPNAPTIDELLAEWEELWLESLKYQVYDLHHRREIHDEFMDLLDASDHPDTEIFRDAYHGMYIESAGHGHPAPGGRRSADAVPAAPDRSD